MEEKGISSWTEAQWEQEYETLMAIAREHLDPNRERGETVVLRTAKDNISIVQIPDYCDTESREALENQCIENLRKENDTRVLCVLATIRGENLEIPSWNFREQLIRLNEANLQTETFLWGGEDRIYLKPFHRLLPPNYKISKEE